MIASLRKSFNDYFTKEQYEKFLNDLHSVYPGQVDFRVAETLFSFPKILPVKYWMPVRALLILSLIPNSGSLPKMLFQKNCGYREKRVYLISLHLILVFALTMPVNSNRN